MKEELLRICAGKNYEIYERAVAEDWTPERCELELKRAARPSVVARQPDGQDSGKVLEAACLLSGKHSSPEKHYDDETLERAERVIRGGFGLKQLLISAARANGHNPTNYNDNKDILRGAFGRVEASFSLIDLPGILANVANKFILDGFSAVESTWRRIAAIRSLSDFKASTIHRLSGKEKYEIVPHGGEIQHGTLGEESYSLQADTYGLMLAIDRRDIMNDDLGAITDVPRKLGRGAALKLNDVFWRVFLDNSAFFTTARGNYISGAETALSIDALSLAEIAFMSLEDSSGQPAGTMPAILLVPPQLMALGSQLFNSMELRDTTASVKYPVSNPHQGKYRVEVSRYLSTPSLPGASGKAWYLLSNPLDMPVVEVGFLNGSESPTIETADADFSRLGVQMRGYHDFGVTLAEPLAGVKSKGEV